ncbi:hypothetical protein IWX46DRAFT_659432, partial [Phyllosticta citricarpa]
SPASPCCAANDRPRVCGNFLLRASIYACACEIGFWLVANLRFGFSRVLCLMFCDLASYGGCEGNCEMVASKLGIVLNDSRFLKSITSLLESRCSSSPTKHHHTCPFCHLPKQATCPANERANHSAQAALESRAGACGAPCLAEWAMLSVHGKRRKKETGSKHAGR